MSALVDSDGRAVGTFRAGDKVIATYHGNYSTRDLIGYVLEVPVPGGRSAYVVRCVNLAMTFARSRPTRQGCVSRLSFSFLF